MDQDIVTQNSQPSARAPARAPVWADRLLAEAVRVLEDGHGAPLAEPDIERAARTEDDFESRIIRRARRLAVAPALRDALARMARGLGWSLAGALLIALLAGMGATRLLFGLPAGEPVNIAWLLGGLLLPPSLALMIWVLLLLWRPGAGALLGAAAMWILRAIGGRVVHDETARAALEARLSTGGGGPLGRWRLSALGHALWSAFMLGGLVMGLGVLSLWQVDFVWETTILGDSVVPAILAALAAPLAALGLAVPDMSQIELSRAGSTLAGTAREAWAVFLLGALAVYGLAPRLLLLLFSLAMGGLARRAFRLDLTRLGYERLHERLMAPGRRDGIVDPDPGLPDAPAPVIAEGPPPRLKGDGPVAVVGLESPLPAVWPPAVPGAPWLDLGLVDSRQERARLFDRLETLDRRPRALLVVCSLALTPDRGLAAMMERLVKAAPCPLLLLLSEGNRLRARGDPHTRWLDWRKLALAAGLPANHMIDADLAVADPSTLERLAGVLGLAGEASS